ncbi:MAG TPA: MFS transporter [Actinomycetota bacterium]|nr:MFS transporter [Actinomycetota bacterium]
MSDVRRILLLRGIRSFAYGFTSVLVGVHLADLVSAPRAGAILTATLAGAAYWTFVVGARGDRIGRRRMYVALSAIMAVAMVVFAVSDAFAALLIASLSGTVAATALEAGPFVALEQAMIPGAVEAAHRTRTFGRYNSVAAIVGAFGALAAGGPAALRDVLPVASQRLFVVPALLALSSLVVALRLSDAVEAPIRGAKPLTVSRGRVAKLSALFALDSFGGGFVVQAAIVYWFRSRYGTSEEMLGLVFFGTGMLQAVSFAIATRLADRIGLINTMVFTHLPSNLLLAAVPLAPNEPLAITLLLGRFALSQMDVPVRQSYVMAVVEPEERTAAAGFTTTVRSAAQAAGPAIGGATIPIAGSGLPFFVGGGLKVIYDVLLWINFRRVKPPEES